MRLAGLRGLLFPRTASAPSEPAPIAISCLISDLTVVGSLVLGFLLLSFFFSSSWTPSHLPSSSPGSSSFVLRVLEGLSFSWGFIKICDDNQMGELPSSLSSSASSSSSSSCSLTSSSSFTSSSVVTDINHGTGVYWHQAHTRRHTGPTGPSGHTGPRRHCGLTIALRSILAHRSQSDRFYRRYRSDIRPISAGMHGVFIADIRVQIGLRSEIPVIGPI